MYRLRAMSLSPRVANRSYLQKEREGITETEVTHACLEFIFNPVHYGGARPKSITEIDMGADKPNSSFPFPASFTESCLSAFNICQLYVRVSFCAAQSL